MVRNATIDFFNDFSLTKYSLRVLFIDCIIYHFNPTCEAQIDHGGVTRGFIYFQNCTFKKGENNFYKTPTIGIKSKTLSLEFNNCSIPYSEDLEIIDSKFDCLFIRNPKTPIKIEKSEFSNLAISNNENEKIELKLYSTNNVFNSVKIENFELQMSSSDDVCNGNFKILHSLIKFHIVNLKAHHLQLIDCYSVRNVRENGFEDSFALGLQYEAINFHDSSIWYLDIKKSNLNIKIEKSQCSFYVTDCEEISIYAKNNKINYCSLDKINFALIKLDENEIKSIKINNLNKISFFESIDNTFGNLHIEDCNFNKFNINHFKSGNLVTIRNCDINEITGLNVIEYTDYFFDNCKVESILFINAVVKNLIRFINIKALSEKAIVHIEDSTLGKTEFIGCEFQKFKLLFKNSNILKSFISKPIFKEIDFLIQETDSEETEIYQKELLYNQLKKLMEAQGDKKTEKVYTLDS